ncbi:flagellar motor switch protein FliM [Pistricoccus aurantiacus]|uniref:flagellar motor switch protein FliM n=1 Tax=Pistricoccus aurantiacus TaxID=1883414 RepID=UPI00362D7EE5
MAQDELLSQEEIDALMKGVSGEDESAADANEAKVRPYDPVSQHRVIRERFQVLDIVNERFARLFRISLFNLLRRGVDISMDTVRYQSYTEFLRNTPVPTNLNMVTLKPLEGTALFVFPPSLVFMVVDNLFGGDGRFVTRSEGREFTITEQRIIRRLLDLAINAYQEAWKTVHPLTIGYLRSEMQTKFANITSSPNEIVVNSIFHLEVGALASDFNICMPYAMLEPVRDAMANQTSGGQSRDSSWTRRMAGELRQSEVELVADFMDIPSNLGQVTRLKVGDVLPVELPETVIVRVGDVAVMECEYGRQQQQSALRVKHLIDHAAPVTPTPEAFAKEAKDAQSSFEENNHE